MPPAKRQKTFLLETFLRYSPLSRTGWRGGQGQLTSLYLTVLQANPAVVQVYDNRLHGLEPGDSVIFRELVGMTELEQRSHLVTDVLSPSSFSIDDCSQFEKYVSGGIARRTPRQRHVHFDSLADQLRQPSLLIPDLGRCEAPSQLQRLWQALLAFRAAHGGSLPNAECAEDAVEVISFLQSPLSEEERLLFLSLASVAAGCLPPLCAFIGGFAAQEALKALTGKFFPLHQWLLMDCREVLPNLTALKPTNESTSTNSQQDRLEPLRCCIGSAGLNALRCMRVFMVGCGAIGCEMLKNIALLGIATDSEKPSASPRGLVTITDHDLIEKSNLNRQFLFRPEHIRCPKSVTAATAVRTINPNMRVSALQQRLGPDTERSHFHDDFFSMQDVCVNALDNLEARRYMDARCVANTCALLESGTMGTKGHCQSIVPHLTENYAAANDPVDTEDIPYCTLKSFPSSIEHCIEWAREKFESSFASKPALSAKFWAANDPLATADTLETGSPITGATTAARFIKQRPLNWFDCLSLARNKFQKYFNHRALNLLHAFPLDMRLPDGNNFWALPKRPPQPVEFDVNLADHRLFVWSSARLYATACGITPPSDTTCEPPPAHVLAGLLADVVVADFRPSGKRIVTDETLSREDAELEMVGNLGSGKAGLNSDDAVSAKETARAGGLDVCAQLGAIVRAAAARHDAQRLFGATWPVEFEKDDDTNSHIDFITSAGVSSQ